MGTRSCRLPIWTACMARAFGSPIITRCPHVHAYPGTVAYRLGRGPQWLVNVSSGRALLRPEVSTIADFYGDAGYATGVFGKWHLGANYPYRPQDRGFQESVWYPSSSIPSVPAYWGNDYFDDIYVHNGKERQFQGLLRRRFFR